jgi:7-carboxy-7-deazaguanine synthase
VNEIFLSLQGEGVLSGHPTAFVRTAGCNLECAWCDTGHARDPEDGAEMSVAEVVEKVKAFGVEHVCVTGGEPLLQDDIVELVEALVGNGLFVSVETNGSLPIDPLLDIGPGKVMISMDVKCPSSGMADRNLHDNLSKLRPVDQLKFIIKDNPDLDFAKEVVEGARVSCPIIFQPVWGTDPERLVQRVLEEGLARHGVRVMVQLHKVIWGDKKGV